MQNEQDDELLLKVVLDEGATEARCKAINTQIKFLRDAAKGLEKDFKDGLLSQRQYNESLGRVNDQTKKLIGELTVQKKALDDSRKGIVANSGSLNEMQDRANAAKAAYLALTKAERDNETVGGAVLKRVHDLNQEYEEASKKLNTSRKSVTDYIKDLNILGVRVGDVSDAFKGGVQGAGTFAKAIFTGRGALIALGAVPIVLFLTALVAFLKSTDEGMDRLERATAALTAGFNALLKGVAPLGKLLYDTFAHPYDTLKKLVAGTDEYNVSISGVAKQVRDAALAADAYTAAIQNIDDAQTALIAKQALASEQVELALKQSRDRSLSETERLRILREAGKVEGHLADQTLENERKRTVATQLSILQTVEGAKKGQQLLKQLSTQELLDYVATSGKYSDAQVEAFNKSIAAFVEVRKARSQTEQTIQNRTSALIEQEAASRKSAIEKRLADEKAVAQELLHEAEIAALQAKKNGEDILAMDELVIKRRAAVELIGLKGTQERLLVLAQAQADSLNLTVKYAQEVSARTLGIDKAGIETRLALVRKGTQEELDLRQQLLRVQADEAKNALPADKQNAALRAAQVIAIDAKLKVDLRANQTAFNQEQLTRLQEVDRLRLETEENLSNKSLANQRLYQAKRIELEEKTQTELLNIDKKAGQVTDEQYLTRLNAIQAKALAARRDLNKQIEDDERTTQETLLQTQLNRVQEGSKAELDIQRKQLAVQRAAAIANAKGVRGDIDNINSDFDKKDKKLQDEYNKTLTEKIISVATNANNVISAVVQAQQQRAFDALDKQQEAASKSAGTNADLRGKIEEQYAAKRNKLEKIYAEKRRKIASIENVINTATAVTKAYSEPFPLNLIQAALALATGLAQQSVIDSQTFAKGGIANYASKYFSDGRGSYVQGQGSGTSDSIMARISNGEAIINAKSTERFYNELSAMNVAGGGRAFPGAGGMAVPEVTNFAYGGLPQSNGTDLREIVSAIKDLNIFVTVTDIDQVKGDMTKAKAAGDY